MPPMQLRTLQQLKFVARPTDESGAHAAKLAAARWSSSTIGRDRPEAAIRESRIIMGNGMSVSSIIGPWEGDAATGLMRRCRDSWQVPLCELSDLMVATYISQQIAEVKMCEEAEFRLKNKERDDTEYFDGQLQESLVDARMRAK